MQGRITQRYGASAAPGFPGFQGSVPRSVPGSEFGVGFEVRQPLGQIEMETENAFGEIVAALFDAADAQIDLRTSSIEALEAFQ